MENFTEQQPWGQTVYSVQPGSHLHFQTAKQTVDLITNSHFGRMLFLDGHLQSATADEHLYHQCLVSKGLSMQPQGRVLVAGGAEGATLREIQNYDAANNLGVQEIVMVDWDEQLVNHMDSEEPWSQGSFDDPRLQLKFEDITSFLTNTTTTFDTVILDLLDIDSDESFTWMQEVLEKSIQRLEPKGGFSVNVGRDASRASSLVSFLRSTYPTILCEMHSVFVPSFQETWWILSGRFS